MALCININLISRCWATCLAISSGGGGRGMAQTGLNPRSRSIERDCQRLSAFLVLIASVLVFSIIGGCIGPDDSFVPEDVGSAQPQSEPGSSIPTLGAPCKAFKIPSLALGTEASYAVEGKFSTVQQPQPFLDMSVFGEPWSSRIPDFPEGSRIDVGVAKETQPRIDQWGYMVQANQIAYWAQVPGSEVKVHFLDEWVDAINGTYIQDHTRIRSVVDGHVQNTAMTTRIGRPGTLFSSVLWGETLDHGWTLSNVFPGQWFTPVTSEGDVGEVHYSVQGLGMIGGNCAAHIRVDVDWPSWQNQSIGARLTNYSADLFVEQTSSLPVWLMVTGIDPTGRRVSFEMNRTDYTVGVEDQAIAKAGPGEKETSRYSPLETRDGIPMDNECRWGTCVHQAFDRVRKHPEAAKWLIENPQAEVRFILHKYADPSSNYFDEWVFGWEAGGQDMVAIHNTFRTGDVPQIFVNFHDSEHPIPPHVAKMLSLDDMAEIHENVFEAPPEFLVCSFKEPGGTCSINSHLGRGEARLLSETDWSTWLKLSGVLLDYQTGRIHQINTYDPATLGPSYF